MPYEFAENEDGLDPLAASARSVGPPRKFTRIGIVDPPFPPKKPLDPIPSIPLPGWLRGFTGLLLFAIAVALIFLLFARR